MSKILFFIFDNMTDYETSLVLHLLKVDAGFDITMISYEDRAYEGRTGAIFKPSKRISDVDLDEYSGIIIPGGWYGELRDELKEIIVKLNKDSKLVAGICGAGTVLLAKSGVLQNRKFTTPVTKWSEKENEVFGGQCPFNYTELASRNVVRDNNVITATGIGFIDFSVEICDYFNLFEDENEKHSFKKMYKLDES